jgi:hypothetical protein
LAAKRKIEEVEDDSLNLYKKMSKKGKLEMVKVLIYSKKLEEQDGNEEPAQARSVQVEVHASSSRSILSPSNKRMVNLESTKKKKGIKIKKPAHVPSASKPKSVTYAMPKSIGPATKPTPILSVIKLEDDKVGKFKSKVDSRFLKVQTEIGNVNSNMESWMKLLME